MQRSYSYDASQVIGTQAQVEAIQGSLVDDMVQAILFRLQAVRKNGEEAAVKAAGTAAPASAASTMNSSPQAIPSTTIP
jgi:LPS-assembly lipoprotein